MHCKSYSKVPLRLELKKNLVGLEVNKGKLYFLCSWIPGGVWEGGGGQEDFFQKRHSSTSEINSNIFTCYCVATPCVLVLTFSGNFSRALEFTFPFYLQPWSSKVAVSRHLIRVIGVKIQTAFEVFKKILLCTLALNRSNSENVPSLLHGSLETLSVLNFSRNLISFSLN